MFGFFNKKDISIVQPTRILVCTIIEGERFEQEALSDATIYKKYYPNVIFKFVQDSEGLIDLIRLKKFDVLHVLARISSQGKIGGLALRLFLNVCKDNGIKIIFLASGVPINIDMKHFESGPFHLIITLDRKGKMFGDFLDKILSQLSIRKSLPEAWVNVVSQNPRAQINNLQPECIFSAGCGQVKFLP